ncbi:MAG: branched-chain amino acid ABC transporter permease [Acidimicrobiales bacterium]|nr:MAG: branched-chain amino acid ABC transporter permease [Acidimicrobiales bacterium]
MQDFVSYTLAGITTGMVYSSVAMALVLIWRATRVVNFAQGGLAMLTTYLAVSLVDRHAPYWLAFVAALAGGLLVGAALEVALVRPLASRPPLNAVIVTLGLLILVEAAAGLIWGGGLRQFPGHFSMIGFTTGRTTVNFSPFDVFTVGAVVAMLVALVVLFRATNMGLRMRAAANGAEVARLLGVRVGRILTLGWALAALAGSLSGLLVAPNTFLSPNYMDAVLVYGFTAAVVGGLDSPVGALIGGLITGLALSYLGGYVSGRLETLGALAILVVVLLSRPSGLLGHSSPRRV